MLALAGAPEGPLRDAVTLLLRFESGALGAIHVAWTDAQVPPVYSLDVHSHEVALELVLDPVVRLHGRAGGELIEQTSGGRPARVHGRSLHRGGSLRRPGGALHPRRRPGDPPHRTRLRSRHHQRRNRAGRVMVAPVPGNAERGAWARQWA